MKKEYFPEHKQNRMKNEGNLIAAREYFLEGKNRVLYHLVQQRYSWMNKYIKDTDKTVIELGCGAGLSRLFIDSENLILTDVNDNVWVDQYLDALNLKLADESQDVIICSNMIHHLSNPAKFLDDVSKKLNVGGRLIIQDIYAGTLMKLALRVMRHEGWSDLVDIYDRQAICNDPSDPWSANCSIPKLLFFKDKEKFCREFPKYKILECKRNECFLFFLSGGVIAKTFHLPVGDKGAKVIQKLDRILIKLAPDFFSGGCSVVLQRT